MFSCTKPLLNPPLMGTLQRLAEIGAWVQAPGAFLWGSKGITPWKNYETVYAKSCNLVHFDQKMVGKAVHNAFLNTLTVQTSFSCIPASFQQRIRRSDAFPLEMNLRGKQGKGLALV